MNKAFVKDDDAYEDLEIELDPEADIPAGSRNYMTPQGARGLREELDDLVQEQRPQLQETINRLGRDGIDPADASFREARKTSQRLEKRISFLTGRLAITEVIDPVDQDSDHIRFGATVTVQPSSGPQKDYRIVGIDEAEIEHGRISWTSPLARSLLDGKAGDVVKVSTPAGEQELEIVQVRYLEIR
jgi:transcription elongation factor GreB